MVRADKVLLYQKQSRESYQRPTASELERFGRGLRLLKKYVEHRQPEKLTEARLALHEVNYDVQIIQDRLIYLSERSPARGWGLYVLNLEKPAGLLIEVPAPMDEWATLEAGAYLFRELAASSLAVAGTQRQNNSMGASDVFSVVFCIVFSVVFSVVF